MTGHSIHCVRFLGHTHDNAFPHSHKHAGAEEKHDCPGFDYWNIKKVIGNKKEMEFLILMDLRGKREVN